MRDCENCNILSTLKYEPQKSPKRRLFEKFQHKNLSLIPLYRAGYFTSRPFYKNLDRILEHYLRSAEVIFSMTWAEMEYVGSDFPEMASSLMENIVYGRQNLALFQHHDGVTGTAKDHVVVDYGERMLELSLIHI